MAPKKICRLCSTAITYNSFSKHIHEKHSDELLDAMRKKYKDFHSPPAYLSVSIGAEKSIYLCVCCDKLYLSEKSFKDHHILNQMCQNCPRQTRVEMMEIYLGLKFKNAHAPVASIAPIVPTQSNANIEVLLKRIEELVCLNTDLKRKNIELHDEIDELQLLLKVREGDADAAALYFPKKFGQYAAEERLRMKKEIAALDEREAAAPPANVITEPAPATVLKHALINDLSGNALKRTMSEPNMAPAPERRVVFSNMTELPVEQQMPKMTVFQQQVAARKAAEAAKLAAIKSVPIPPQNNPTCVHCDIQNNKNYISCAKCQQPIHFGNDPGYCSDKTRMCAHEDCEDAKFCEKCASKILGPEDEDEDDLCVRHRA